MIELVASLTLNGLCLAYMAYIKFFEKKINPPKVKDSYELSQFMMDLLAGDGLIRVQRIAPHDVLIKSPRNRI